MKLSQLHKGVNVGKVTKVSLNKDQKVEVKAILYDDYASYAKLNNFLFKNLEYLLQEIANVGINCNGCKYWCYKSTETKNSNKIWRFRNQPSVEKIHFGTVFQVEDSTASSV